MTLSDSVYEGQSVNFTYQYARVVTLKAMRFSIRVGTVVDVCLAIFLSYHAFRPPTFYLIANSRK